MRDPKNGSRSFFFTTILTLTLFVAAFAPLMSFQEVSAITWNPIEEISEDKRIEYQRYPAIAADGGKTYAVWADNGDRDYDIFVREHNGTAWLLEEEVNTDDRDIDQFLPDIAADGDVVHVVWHDPINGDYDIMYRQKSGGGWDPLMELSSDVGLESQQNPVVAAAEGKVYVAWQDGRDGDWDIYFRYYDGFAWGAVQEISTDLGTEAQSFPSIAAGGGKAYVVWEDAGGGDNDIVMRVFNGLFWGSIMEVSQDSASEVQNVPDVAYDTGTVHVVWEEFRTTDRDIYHRSWEGLIFSAIQEISIDSGTEFQDVPSVAAKFGKVHTVWADRGDGDWDIVYRQFDGLSWLAPEEISADAGNENQWLPGVAADVGAVHVVWEDQGDGDNDIFYRRGNVSMVVDNEPPEILNVLLDGSPTQTHPLSSLPPTMTLTATVDDSTRGNSTIGGANYTIGPGNWGTSVPMIPDDFLNTPAEGFHAILVSPITTGTWQYCVYGWDIALNYNVTGLCASLTITDDMQPIVTSVLINGLTIKSIPIGTPSVTLTATVDDRPRGDSVIGGANYTSPSQNWANSSLMIQDNALDTSVEGFHATIVTSLLGFGNYQICAYGWDILLNRNTTGECANLVVALETLPPITKDVIINGLASATYGISSVPALLLIATVDDTTTGNSIIGGANYTIEPQNWSSSTPMIPNNALDTPLEWFNADLAPSTFSIGVYQICAYGWDNMPNFDDVGSCATLTITDDIIPEIRNVTINGSSPFTIVQGTANVQLNATVDDSGTGGSVIGGANYTWGAGNFPGTLMNAVNPPLDSDIEDFESTVDTASLMPGIYQLCVYGWDIIPNNNYTGECADLSVAPEINPPMILDVLINGQSAQNFEFLAVPFLNLTATIDDSLTGNTSIAGANFTVGLDNWPSATDMAPDDILDTSIEGAYFILNPPAITGTWEYCVYGWDAVPNYNSTGSCATLRIYDGTPPEVLNVLINGSTVLPIPSGTPNVTLTATVDDVATGESIIAGANYTSPSQDWSNSTNMTPDEWLDTPIEGFSAVVNTSALGLGSYDICVYGRDEELNNDTVGDCARILVTGDFEPPSVSNVLLNGQVTLTLGLSELNGITLTANIDDRLTGNSTISGANYSWSPPTWPGTSMVPDDGFFDSPVEDVSAIVTAIAQTGSYIIWVEGCDEYYNCGYGLATLVVEDDLPPAVTNISLDSVTTRTIPAGTPTVTLTVNINDTATGGSIIGGANFTSPALAWGNSTSMVPRNLPLDSMLEEFNATIDTHLLVAGTYEFWVYGWDVLDNLNTTPIVHATLVVEGEIPVDNPPTIDSLVVDPSQAEKDEEVEVVVEATDDSSVEEVWIEVVGPDDQVVENASAQYNQTRDRYIVVLSYHDPGIYDITAWVQDDGGNWASEVESFEILEEEDEEPEPVVAQPNVKPVLAIVFLLLLLLFGSEALRRSQESSWIRKFWFIPFALAELATCVISAISGSLSIPPVLGLGLAVDLTILILGMSMPLLLLLQKSPTIEEESDVLDNEPERSNNPENTK